MIPTMSGQWVAWVIAVHDLTIGVSLLARNVDPSCRDHLLLVRAGAWLLAVALVKLSGSEGLWRLIRPRTAPL